MERLEQQIQAKSPESETASNLLESVRDGYTLASARGLNIENEAQSIAKHFDFSKANGEYSKSMEDGAKQLSSTLQKLSGDMPSYNKLLTEVAKNISENKSEQLPMTPELKLGDFDFKTGTFKNALIYINADSWDSHEAFRIVQPGNTLSQIVKDSYEDLQKVNDGEPLRFSKGAYQQGIVERNNITDPSKLRVGQVLKMSDN